MDGIEFSTYIFIACPQEFFLRIESESGHWGWGCIWRRARQRNPRCLRQHGCKVSTRDMGVSKSYERRGQTGMMGKLAEMVIPHSSPPPYQPVMARRGEHAWQQGDAHGKKKLATLCSGGRYDEETGTRYAVLVLVWAGLRVCR